MEQVINILFKTYSVKKFIYNLNQPRREEVSWYLSKGKRMKMDNVIAKVLVIVSNLMMQTGWCCDIYPISLCPDWFGKKKLKRLK